MYLCENFEVMADIIRYPIGEQSFETIRNGNWLYVDKTRFIEKIITYGQYYFLGRPRRFGKSLFLNTLKCFFEGKRQLFKGLYADSMDWDWEPYPVLGKSTIHPSDSVILSASPPRRRAREW